ncbi:rubrerythrin family protein [Mobilitalea sibirica]|uniref:Rubrerythrin family protein n=1 Tax=Mobilitalea sibirica TaxID=1462919 RepID=A0A8J7HC24_9FIRM|nr:rubrerythrin family protein [Mobilitalea sibirica]MBH1942361.1 rubrerythrin family protein [Mobilitalea sibirica]
MATDFKKSQTKDNLMRAFAGESQARNRYTFAASQAKKEKLYVISEIFRFTANQEKEHAEIFYDHLKELAGENILVDGAYPVDIADDVAKLLRMAQHNEYEEYDPVYKSFGDIAKEEGFNKVAASFHQIAAIEKTHGDRFARFAEMLEENKLFISDVEVGWMCLNCGHVHWGKEVPKECPVCHHDRGYFIRLDLAPFQNS